MSEIRGKKASVIILDEYEKTHKREIFVFGSNTAGIHGAGAAFTAYTRHGAQMGVGYGLTGDAFAIPTKGGTNYVGKPLSARDIQDFITGFAMFAISRPDLKFKITRIGCGLAGFSDLEMASLFQNLTKTTYPNCFFDTLWKSYLVDDYQFWGTY